MNDWWKKFQDQNQGMTMMNNGGMNGKGKMRGYVEVAFECVVLFMKNEMVCCKVDSSMKRRCLMLLCCVCCNLFVACSKRVEFWSCRRKMEVSFLVFARVWFDTCRKKMNNVFVDERVSVLFVLFALQMRKRDYWWEVTRGWVKIYGILWVRFSEKEHSPLFFFLFIFELKLRERAQREGALFPCVIGLSVGFFLHILANGHLYNGY